MKLSGILPLDDPGCFKAHFARYNGEVQPLEVFARSWQEWVNWNRYYPGRNDFSRPFIFSLIQDYHEPDHWLFGGVFQVRGLEDEVENGDRHYRISLAETGKDLIGRLRIKYDYRQRGTRVNLENHFENLVVAEILREKFSGTPFPGTANINLSFGELETLVTANRPDWRASLNDIKGVYLITDTSTGRLYVGSAYGVDGIWSRWSSYAKTGHGGNVELKKLIHPHGVDYCRQNFHIALLEDMRPSSLDETVIARESHWKNILLSRGERGLNRN